MKTMVIDVNGRGSIFVESDIDRVANKYGMKKVRLCDDGIIGNIFPTHIQYTLKCRTLKAIWISFQVGRETRFCICRDTIKIGWAIEN